MMKRLQFAFAGVLALAAMTTAQAEGELVVTDVVYGHKDGMALVLDVYKPAGEPNGAGVAFMVSGGWVSSLGMQRMLGGLFKPLIDAGFTVFAVRHGSSPRYNVLEAHADVNRGFRYARLHAKEYGVDPDRLGVMGISAGGHLSLMLGLDSDKGDPGASDEVLRVSDRPTAVVAYMPPTDLRGLTGPSNQFPALDFPEEKAPSVSPIDFVSSDDPPILLIHGSADTLVPVAHSERLHAALDEKNVKNELLIIEGAGHGAFPGEGGKLATEALVGWFTKHLLD